MKTLIRNLAHAAFLSMMEEVNLSPKPGLVDRFDSGAHQDMELALFYKSAEALYPHFLNILEKTPLQAPPAEVLPGIRPSGIQAEKAMFTATEGVNTHKGQIFSLGICLAASLRVLQSPRDPAALPRLVLEEVKQICRNLTLELKPPVCHPDSAAASEPGGSHGQMLFRRWGITGIRGEAEAGFPAALGALALLEDSENRGTEHEDAALKALLFLYAQAEDSNVLYRCGPEGLSLLQRTASAFLKQTEEGAETAGGSSFFPESKTLAAMNRLFIRENISPGGCADLLAITFFLQRLKQGFHPKVCLQDMAAARETRIFRRRALKAQEGEILLQLSVNIPGNQKTSPEITDIYLAGLAMLRNEFAGEIQKTESFPHFKTGPEAYLLVKGSLKEVKKRCCKLEKAHPSGRLWDLDVFDSKGQGISRRELGMPPRTCFLCGEPAHLCARSRRHSAAELQAFIRKLCKNS